MVLAATAMGFDAQWQTDWVAYDPEATAAMGLKGAERVSGIICIGTTTAPLEDRPRPDAQTLLTRWRRA
jgi:nitroreductase